MAKKRGQGEGSIYRRKDGLWTAQVTVEGKHISKYFKTQQEARIMAPDNQFPNQGWSDFIGSQYYL